MGRTIPHSQEALYEATAHRSRRTHYAAFVALDWADQEHAYIWSAADSAETYTGKLENTPEQVEVWITQLLARFPQQPIAVALEQRRGAMIVLLSKYAHVHLYPVHPKTLADYRQAWFPSRSKSDPGDAALLWEILVRHRDRLRPLQPESPDLRLLQGWVENRRKLVEERTALTNRLQDTLKICFPQMVRWFADLSTALVGDLLQTWPSLDRLQKAKPAQVEKLLRQHRCKPERIAQLLAEIQSAVAATHDAAILQAAEPMIAAWLQQIAAVRRAVSEMEKRIARLAEQQPDWAIFASLPGAGPVLAPRLMAALGSQRERFASAHELQCFSGIAPVREASGQQHWIHFRWACPKFLRQSFHEWAACSIPQCDWARRFYQQQLNQGKTRPMAIRALAFKWIRILFRCWQEGRPYQEETYLANRQRRLCSTLAAAVKSL